MTDRYCATNHQSNYSNDQVVWGYRIHTQPNIHQKSTLAAPLLHATPQHHVIGFSQSSTGATASLRFQTPA